MTESEYWSSLEYRVTRELARAADGVPRGLWCDGFIPEHYLLDDAVPRVTGRAWMCKDRKQDAWAFTLVLPRAFESRVNVEWGSLLPSDGSSGWLALDFEDEALSISIGGQLDGALTRAE